MNRDTESYLYAIEVIENNEDVLALSGGIEHYKTLGRKTKVVHYSNAAGEYGEFTIPIKGKVTDINVTIAVEQDKGGKWEVKKFHIQ